MKLVVLAGAKSGAAVPIKKNSFIIGRSKEAALRAGSDAISRKHCEIQQGDAGVTVRDLGSRNGTYVNGEKIEGDHPLTNGDTLKVGPLEFRFESEAQIKKVKAPSVKNVADAVARAAEKSSSSSGSLGEDDISEWLLGESGTGDTPEIGETLSMRTDETSIGSGQEADEDVETKVISPSDSEDEPEKPKFQVEKEQTKDSREAAANVLRDMSRRR